MTTATTLHRTAWANATVAQFVRSSFRNLDRKRIAGTLNRDAAIRLLRYNARDAARAIGTTASDCDLQQCAQLLYADWTARHTTE